MLAVWFPCPHRVTAQATHRGRIPPPVVLHKNQTVEEVMDTVIKGRIHRVWVVDDNNRPTGVVTYSDLLQVGRVCVRECTTSLRCLACAGN